MKIVGYILAVLGLVGIAAYTIPEVSSFLLFTQSIDDTMLIIVSLVLAAIGIFFIAKGGNGRRKQPSEVPIYHGKNVVGYRRMKK